LGNEPEVVHACVQQLVYCTVQFHNRQWQFSLGRVTCQDCEYIYWISACVVIEQKSWRSLCGS